MSSGLITVADIEAVRGSQTIRYKEVQWRSDANGDVSQTFVLHGQILRVVLGFQEGQAVPTDQYDVFIADQFGINILLPYGGNISNTDATEVAPFVGDNTLNTNYPRYTTGLHTLVVANAGDTKYGKIGIFYKD